ncbi:hypothetical protein [Duganella fentianensis]|uniref:hypothetical protein n=1 Tax=Duganella fentianensis TaxID=2692177 RepID=UPI0032B10BF9
MFAAQSVELPQPTYTALREYLKQQGRLGQVSSALADAVALWLEKQQDDKTFKQACVVRLEVEREAQALRQARLETATSAGPAPSTPSSPALPSVSACSPETPSYALPAVSDTSLAPQALAAIVTSVLAHMTPPRDTTPNPGWNLPERRKYRYRLEDVAFE